MIIEKIGKPAMLEQLAEEAAELAQAALKCARILRDENPTPVSMEDAVANLSEEVTDVSTCLDELKIYPMKDIYEAKRARWLGRLEEKNTETDAGCDGDSCDISHMLERKAEDRSKSAAWLDRISGGEQVTDSDNIDLREEMFARNHGG